MEEWSKKTVAILKAECASRGLDAVGKKAQLVERIVQYEENALLAENEGEDMETAETKTETEDADAKSDTEEVKTEAVDTDAEQQDKEMDVAEAKQDDGGLITKPAPINIPYKKDVSTEIMRESRVRMVSLGPVTMEMLKEEKIHDFLLKGETFSVNFYSVSEPGHCQVRMKSYEAAKELVEECTLEPLAEDVTAKQLPYEGGGGVDSEGAPGITYGQSRDNRVLYCHGLPEDMTEPELTELVPEAWIVYILKDENKKSKGCGYLEFKDSQSMQEYLDASETIPYGNKKISLFKIPKTTEERKKMLDSKNSSIKVPIKKVMSEDVFRETHEREVVCGPLELEDLKNDKLLDVLKKSICFNIRFHTEGRPGHVQMRFASCVQAAEIEKEMKDDPLKEDLIVKKLSNEVDYLTRTVGQNAKINAVLRGEKENPLEYLEDRVLYVHNLPDSATENDLKSLTPEPQGVYIIKGEKRTPQGYGYLEFQTSVNMKAFFDAVKSFPLDGHKVELFNIPKISALKKDAKDMVKVPSKREAYQEYIKETNDREAAFGPVTVDDLQLQEVRQILDQCEGFSVWFFKDKNEGHVQLRMSTYADCEALVEQLTQTPFKDNLKVKMIGALLHEHEKSVPFSPRTSSRSEKISEFLKSEDEAQKTMEPLESRLLYVHNLPKAATEEHLLKLFPEASIACIPKDVDRKSKGHAYLEFKNLAEVQEFQKKAMRTKKVYALDNHLLSFHQIPGTSCVQTPVKKTITQQSPANKVRKMDNSGQFNRYQNNNQRWAGNQQGNYRNNQQQQRGNFQGPSPGGFKRPGFQANNNNNMGGGNFGGGFRGNQMDGFRGGNQGGGFNNQGGFGVGNQGGGFGANQAGGFGGNRVGGVAGMNNNQGPDAVNLIVELGQILSRQSVSNQSQNANVGQASMNNSNQGNFGFQGNMNQGYQSQNQGYSVNNQSNYNTAQGRNAVQGRNTVQGRFGNQGNTAYGNQGDNNDRWNRKRKASFSSNTTSFAGQGKMQRQGQNTGGRFQQGAGRWNKY